MGKKLRMKKRRSEEKKRGKYKKAILEYITKQQRIEEYWYVNWKWTYVKCVLAKYRTKNEEERNTEKSFFWSRNGDENRTPTTYFIDEDYSFWRHISSLFFSSLPKRSRAHEKKEQHRVRTAFGNQNAGILNIFGVVVYVPGVLQWHWLIFAAFNILKKSVNHQRWQSKPNVQTKRWKKSTKMKWNDCVNTHLLSDTIPKIHFVRGISDIRHFMWTKKICTYTIDRRWNKILFYIFQYKLLYVDAGEWVRA